MKEGAPRHLLPRSDKQHRQPAPEWSHPAPTNPASPEPSASKPPPQGFSVRCERVVRLLETLHIARGDGSCHKRLAAFAKTELLILGNFGLKPLTQEAERLDLLELINDRHGLPWARKLSPKRES